MRGRRPSRCDVPVGTDEDGATRPDAQGRGDRPVRVHQLGAGRQDDERRKGVRARRLDERGERPEEVPPRAKRSGRPPPANRVTCRQEAELARGQVDRRDRPVTQVHPGVGRPCAGEPGHDGRRRRVAVRGRPRGRIAVVEILEQAVGGAFGRGAVGKIEHEAARQRLLAVAGKWHRQVAPGDREPFRLVRVEEGVSGVAAHGPGELPAEIRGVRDRGVHAPAADGRHPVRGIAGKERQADAPSRRELRDELERHRGEQLDGEVGHAGNGPDRVDRRGLAPEEGVEDGPGAHGRVHPPVPRVHGQQDARGHSRSAHHVQGIPAVTEPLEQSRRPEQERRVVLEAGRAHRFDAEDRAHPAPAAVGADDVPGVDHRVLAARRVTDHGGDAVGILLERDELGREPEVGEAQLAKACDEHRLHVILGADHRTRRADRGGLVRGGEAERHDAGGRSRQGGGDVHQWQRIEAAGADRRLHPEAPEDLHRANAHPGGPRVDRRPGVLLHEHGRHAVVRERERGHEAGRAGTDDEDRGVDRAHRGAPLHLFHRTDCIETT